MHISYDKIISISSPLCCHYSSLFIITIINHHSPSSFYVLFSSNEGLLCSLQFVIPNVYFLLVSLASIMLLPSTPSTVYLFPTSYLFPTWYPRTLSLWTPGNSDCTVLFLTQNMTLPPPNTLFHCLFQTQT